MEDKLYSILGCGLILFSTFQYFWKVSRIEVESSLDHCIKVNGIGFSIGIFVLGVWLSSSISSNVTGYALIIDSLLIAGFGYLKNEISTNLKKHRTILLIFAILAFTIGVAILLL